MIGLLLGAAILVAQVPTSPTPAPVVSGPTVQRPLGTSVKPVPGAQSAATSYGDATMGNGYTNSPPLGPQQKIGVAIPHYIHYIAADAFVPVIVYNEYAPGSKTKTGKSYELLG